MEASINTCEHCRNGKHTTKEHKKLYVKEYNREYCFWSRKMKSGNSRVFKPKDPFTNEALELSIIHLPDEMEKFRAAHLKRIDIPD